MTPAEQVGKKIREARERKGMTQKQCAAKLPVAQSTWCDWESGVSVPRVTNWPGIKRLLGIRIASVIA